MNQILHSPVDMFIITFIVTMILLWVFVIPLLIAACGIVLWIKDILLESWL